MSEGETDSTQCTLTDCDSPAICQFSLTPVTLHLFVAIAPGDIVVLGAEDVDGWKTVTITESGHYKLSVVQTTTCLEAYVHGERVQVSAGYAMWIREPAPL